MFQGVDLPVLDILYECNHTVCGFGTCILTWSPDEPAPEILASIDCVESAGGHGRGQLCVQGEAVGWILYDLRDLRES